MTDDNAPLHRIMAEDNAPTHTFDKTGGGTKLQKKESEQGQNLGATEDKYSGLSNSSYTAKTTIIEILFASVDDPKKKRW